MDNLISVIIPMYNSQSTIEACLESIIAQTHKNFEVVLVNDGSTDNSAELAKNFRGIIPRFNIFDQQNAGPSAARNLGIQKATGDWIFFMDADDTIPKDCFETFINIIRKHPDVDIIVGRAALSNSWEATKFTEEQQLLDTKEKIASFATETIINDDWTNRYPLFYSCGKLIRSSIIIDNNLKFNTKINHGEDALFSAGTLRYCNQICIIDKPVYSYYFEQESLSNNNRDGIDSCQASLEFEKKVIDTFKDWQVLDKMPQIYIHSIRMFQIFIIDLIRQKSVDYKATKTQLTKLFKNEMWSRCVHLSKPESATDKTTKTILLTKNVNCWILFIKFCRKTGALTKPSFN